MKRKGILGGNGYGRFWGGGRRSSMMTYWLPSDAGRYTLTPSSEEWRWMDKVERRYHLSHGI